MSRFLLVVLCVVCVCSCACVRACVCVCVCVCVYVWVLLLDQISGPQPPIVAWSHCLAKAARLETELAVVDTTAGQTLTYLLAQVSSQDSRQ